MQTEYIILKLFGATMLGLAIATGFYTWYAWLRAGYVAINLTPVLLTEEQHRSNDSELLETARMLAEGKIAYNNSKK